MKMFRFITYSLLLTLMQIHAAKAGEFPLQAFIAGELDTQLAQIISETGSKSIELRSMLQTLGVAERDIIQAPYQSPAINRRLILQALLSEQSDSALRLDAEKVLAKVFDLSAYSSQEMATSRAQHNLEYASSEKRISLLKPVSASHLTYFTEEVKLPTRLATVRILKVASLNRGSANAKTLYGVFVETSDHQYYYIEPASRIENAGAPFWNTEDSIGHSFLSGQQVAIAGSTVGEITFHENRGIQASPNLIVQDGSVFPVLKISHLSDFQ